MDECGERIPQAVIDGFNDKLKKLKRDIVDEVSDKIVDRVVIMAVKEATKGITDRVAAEIMNKVVIRVDNQIKNALNPPEPVHHCLGQYRVGEVACNGNGNGSMPCVHRDDCLAIKAVMDRSDDGVVVTRFNLHDLVQQGLEILTNPDGGE